MPGDYGQGGIEQPGRPRCPSRDSAARITLRLTSLAALVALAGAAAAVSVGAGSGGPSCARPKLDAAYSTEVNDTLAAHQDVWGNELLRSPDGPTYAGVRRYLHPLMLVGRPAGLRPSRLTDSGVDYPPFGSRTGRAAQERCSCTSPTGARSSRG